MNKKFENEVKNNIQNLGNNKKIKFQSVKWIEDVSRYNYSYNFKWLGRPIIQFPQDIVAIQEIIWKVKPDLIIETGIAHGGSLVLSASILELMGKGNVVGIDIDIRKHNKKYLENHFLSKRIKMIEGSSTDNTTIQKIKKIAHNKKKILVILDSNHTHEHVLSELELYSQFVKKDSYLIVLDTIIEDMHKDYFKKRSWGKGNNPKTAVKEFLKINSRFIIDKEIENKLIITVAPDGYLKCIKN